MATAYFAFTTRQGEQEFVIRLNEDKLIDQARRILSGKENSETHVMGRIIKKRADHNPNYSFHLDPETIRFFQVAMEIGDATATYVEDHLDEACGAFLPGCMWTPWTSTLTREVKI
jgi:hypothetical protein